jgi:hypothetical protein
VHLSRVALLALFVTWPPAAATVEGPYPYGKLVPQNTRDDGKFLAAWVKRLAGRNSIACGMVPFAERKRAAACAGRAVAGKTPFWIAYEDVSLDYGGWHGFARDAKGEMWLVTHDLGSKMKNMERPQVLKVVSCKRLKIEREMVRCDGF